MVQPSPPGRLRGSCWLPHSPPLPHNVIYRKAFISGSVCVISQSGVTLKVMHKQLFVLTFHLSCSRLNAPHMIFTSQDKCDIRAMSALTLLSTENLKLRTGSEGRINKEENGQLYSCKAVLCCVLLHVCVQWWDALLTYCIRWSLCFVLTL